MVTLECVDIEVSSGATDISWSFIAGLDSLTYVKFICEAQVNAENSPSAFVGLDSLTKIEFDKVDFSVALPSVFETIITLVEVSITNAGILNLEFIAPEIRDGILELDLTSNSINEERTDNFNGFVNLTRLILVDNGFTKLERVLFQEMQRLDTLDLSDN
ncbi:hypothetical protein LOD99_16050 [Oopsacas minuta]|uniref:Uncharacterized protein n=1 Tax=Oopsacas minuta TaxID=111878 RepID=A0AAV7K642_9METZ|nr:hypothetical protein LOD99_16050 [Oopsacas minuta]